MNEMLFGAYARLLIDPFIRRNVRFVSSRSSALRSDIPAKHTGSTVDWLMRCHRMGVKACAKFTAPSSFGA